MRFEYSLKSCDRVMMYIAPFDGVRVTNWSFDRTPLDEGHTPPYLVYYLYSLIEEPLDFWVELEHEASNTAGPYFKLVVNEHFEYHPEHYTEDYKQFLATFPDWTYTTDWFAALESWVV